MTHDYTNGIMIFALVAQSFANNLMALDYLERLDLHILPDPATADREL